MAQLLYDYEQERPPIVAENSRQHWNELKDRLARLLKFAEAVNDEVHRLNSEEDRALLEHAAGTQNGYHANGQAET